MAHEDKFHGYLANGRRERRQATQTEIYAYTTKGQLGKTVVTYADADKVEETLERLHKLNPGRRYATREA
jgi:16S rRNA C1402 (ribose-2'-O) methylase RsmI